MEGLQFDAMVKTLAISRARRRLLGWFGGLAAGAMAGVVGLHEAAAACTENSDCPKPRKPCRKAVCKRDGTCGAKKVANGRICNDRNPCTSGTTCTDGVCGGGTPVENCCRKVANCPGTDTECSRRTCLNNRCGVILTDDLVICGPGGGGVCCSGVCIDPGNCCGQDTCIAGQTCGGGGIPNVCG